MPKNNAFPAVSSIEYFVDADEAARFLKIDRRTVIRWAYQGLIPAYPLNAQSQRKDWRFRLSELSAWMSEQVNLAG
ncbi:MAG: helix-turn-helix domain-containing protein, partial [Acidobacteriales bacterium]|nr:helix-turn-helix domain-containing protein [Terriglobales bacterium]